MSHSKMFATDQSKSEEKKSDSLSSHQKEISSITVQPCRPTLCDGPRQFFVTISYKDNTNEEKFMSGGSIWKRYFQFLNKDDQQLFTRQRYEQEHCYLPPEDQEPGLPKQKPYELSEKSAGVKLR